METCDEIYLKASALDECYDERESTVKAIAEVFDELISPDRLSDLNDIGYKDFEKFLNISPSGFLDLVDPVDRDEDGDRRRNNDDWEDLYAYDSDTARLVLEWLANEEDISKGLKKHDKDNDIVKELLSQAGSDPEESEREPLCGAGYNIVRIGSGDYCLKEKGSGTCTASSEGDERIEGVNYCLKRKGSGNCASLGETEKEIENTDYCLGHIYPKCEKNKSNWSQYNLNMALGFSDNAYDDVSLWTYAYSQREDNKKTSVEEILESIIADSICPVGNCDDVYLCLARVYEGSGTSLGAGNCGSTGANSLDIIDTTVSGCSL